MSTKRSDFASGLVYFGYRFYVPHLDRWLNRDPLQEQGGINLYGYVHGDPLGYVDPDGRYAIWVARGVAAAVGAGSDYLIQLGFIMPHMVPGSLGIVSMAIVCLKVPD